MSYNSGVIVLVISNHSPDFSTQSTQSRLLHSVLLPLLIIIARCFVVVIVIVVTVVVAILAIITGILMYI